MDLLRWTAIDQNAAIVCVTHDVMTLDPFDHIFRLRDGRLEVDLSIGAGPEKAPAS
jgi:putative ABC transport system ATP-binding protein